MTALTVEETTAICLHVCLEGFFFAWTPRQWFGVVYLLGQYIGCARQAFVILVLIAHHRPLL
jgi:hypothetical protein